LLFMELYITGMWIYPHSMFIELLAMYE
jgi:hypothetical protein